MRIQLKHEPATISQEEREEIGKRSEFPPSCHIDRSIIQERPFHLPYNMHAAKHTQRIIFYIISFIRHPFRSPFSPPPSSQSDTAANKPARHRSINHHMHHPTPALTPNSMSITDLALKMKTRKFRPVEDSN